MIIDVQLGAKKRKMSSMALIVSFFRSAIPYKKINMSRTIP
jgi:hypothetical protein